MWCRGSQIFMRVARGSASWLSSHGRGLGPRDARARRLEAGKRWARLAQARAASRPGLCAGGLQSRGLQRIGHDCVKTPTHILSSPQDDEPHCDGAYETCTFHIAADRPVAKAGLVPKPCVNAGHSTRAWILAAGVHWGGLPCPPQGVFLTQRSNPGLLRFLHW